MRIQVDYLTSPPVTMLWIAIAVGAFAVAALYVRAFIAYCIAVRKEAHREE